MCLYRPYWWRHRKCTIVFVFFVGASACEVPTADKRGASSTHHKDPAENPTSSAVWSTHFQLSLLTISPTRKTFESIIDADGGHYEGHGQKFHVHHGCFYATHKPDPFYIALSPYAFHNMVNVSGGDFCIKTQNWIFVHSTISDIFNCAATIRTLNKGTTVM